MAQNINAASEEYGLSPNMTKTKHMIISKSQQAIHRSDRNGHISENHS